MNKTKIEWCDSTWNPVTGCYHVCEYCYARKMANRFGSGCESASSAKIHELNTPILGYAKASESTKKQPYPYSFEPTLHRYHLDDYKDKKGRTIFVCSMADLFGEWVPDTWIEEVFAACKVAPQHRYLFLTKNPKRYTDLHLKGKLPTGDNMWYGVTPTEALSRSDYFYAGAYHTFASAEPILKECSGELEFMCDTFAQWVIIGAETGRRKGKVTPKKEWIIDIIKTCIESKTPFFMKDSLVPIVGEENMFRMLPWEQSTWEIGRQLKLP